MSNKVFNKPELDKFTFAGHFLVALSIDAEADLILHLGHIGVCGVEVHSETFVTPIQLLAMKIGLVARFSTALDAKLDPVNPTVTTIIGILILQSIHFFAKLSELLLLGKFACQCGL